MVLEITGLNCFLFKPCYDTLVSNYLDRIGQDNLGIRSPVKIIKQLVGFVLGVAIGVCLHSILTLRPLSLSVLWNAAKPTQAHNPRANLRSPWVQPSMPTQASAPERVQSEKVIHAVLPEIPELPAELRPAIEPVRFVEAAEGKEGTVASISTGPPVPTVFQTIGYVEQAGGMVEAIILQENQVQVVHMGDLIAGRYRVTKVSPDSVEATEDKQTQSPMTKPGVTQSDILTASVTPPPSAPPPPIPPVRAAAQAVPGTSYHYRNIHNADILKTDSHIPMVVVQGQPASGSVSPRENPIAAPHGADAVTDSLGFVQKANGRIESVVADGDTVRLIPQTSTVTLAQAAPPDDFQGGERPNQGVNAAMVSSAKGTMADSPAHPATSSGDPLASVIKQVSYPAPAPGLGTPGGSAEVKPLVAFKPLGIVEHNDGELAAVLTVDDEIFVVRQGDRFDGRYRAVSVSTDAVEAVEVPMTRPPSFHLDAPPAPGRDPKAVQRQTQLAKGLRRDFGRASQQAGLSPEPSTFIFQTLGYAETQDGDLQAVVADGSEVYLVRQGETFAGQYRATSVDPVLVLAVKAPPEKHAGIPLSAQTESGDKPASKNLYLPLFAWASIQNSHEFGASGSLFLTDLGMNLLNSSLTGFGF